MKPTRTKKPANIAIERLIKAAGGRAPLARELGVTYAYIMQIQKIGYMAIHHAVKCSELYPEIDKWDLIHAKYLQLKK